MNRRKPAGDLKRLRIISRSFTQRRRHLRRPEQPFQPDVPRRRHTTTAETAVGWSRARPPRQLKPQNAAMDRSHPSPWAQEKPMRLQATEKEKEEERHRLARVTKSCRINAQPLPMQRRERAQEAADHLPNRAIAFRRIGARSASVRPTTCSSSALP